MSSLLVAAALLVALAYQVFTSRNSSAFSKVVSGSKFTNVTGFGEWPDGHILLQDHRDTISFSNLKIRELPAG